MADQITRQLAGLVAAELGEGWTVDTSEHLAEHRGVYLDGPDRARLFLSPDWRNADRLEVTGHYPDGASKVYPTPARHTIGVGRMRGPAVIAREVSRRLLPGYRDTLAEVLRQLEARTTAADQRAAFLERCREALPVLSVDTRDPDRPRASFFVNGEGSWYGDVDAYHDGSRASLELRSLPAALVLEVLEVLARRLP